MVGYQHLSITLKQVKNHLRNGEYRYELIQKALLELTAGQQPMPLRM